MRRAAAIAVVVVAAGCGGAQALPTHAGLNEVEAREFALSALSRELRSPSSPLHGHRVEIVRLGKGLTTGGGDAWVAHVEDHTDGTESCLRLWEVEIHLYDYEWSRCEQREEPETETEPPGDLPS